VYYCDALLSFQFNLVVEDTKEPFDRDVGYSHVLSFIKLSFFMSATAHNSFISKFRFVYRPILTV
jgi:hypothetical protein